MRSIFLLVCLSAFNTAALAADATATDNAEVIATIRQYVTDTNNNDLDAEASRCTSPAMIIDDIPPHVWRSCREWADANEAANRSNGITEFKETLGETWHVEVSADKAYAVYATRFEFKRKGKPVVGNGVWTFVLQKLPEGWRISAWAWAQH